MNSKKLRLKTNKVILKHSITEMELVGRDRTIFLASVLNPPEPCDKLQAAAKRYQQVMGGW